MEYKDYLTTNHWDKTRKQKLSKKDFCQICGSSSNIHIHHKRYKKRNKTVLFNEKDNDLMVLCSSCHRLWHHYFGLEEHYLKKKKLSSIRRLVKAGITTKWAFWICTQPPEFYSLVYRQIAFYRCLHEFFYTIEYFPWALFSNRRGMANYNWLFTT